jgi:hypothetical protein
LAFISIPLSPAVLPPDIDAANVIVGDIIIVVSGVDH